MDAGAEGIHLAWNAPDVVCLSNPGFDIQRRVVLITKSQCVALTSKELIPLASAHEMSTQLGTLLYRQSGPLQPLMSSATSAPWPSATATVDVYTLELTVPTGTVRISGVVASAAPLKPFAIFAVAMSGGKAVASGTGNGDGTPFLLNASGIDTVVVYTVSATNLTICAYAAATTIDGSWTNVPYLVQGLTLPIHEADPTLPNEAYELAAAQARLTVGEALSQADFENLATPLRTAVSQSALGRPGERILLGRETVDDSYQEVSLSDQLAMLQIHPQYRRVCGFGYFDHQSSGLVAGTTYEYRITGHFNAQDLSGQIYDVHTIPSQTTLPDTFYIGNLRLTFAGPVAVVLDPPPDPAGLNAVSRRGISIAAKTSLPGWLAPSLDIWSVVIDLPQAVTSVIIETNASQQFQYAGGFAWEFTATPMPAPEGGLLTFPSAVSQIRLSGSGILFAIRVPAPAQTGSVPAVVVTAPIPFAAQPLPAAPLSFTIANLETPPGQATFTTHANANRGPRRPLPGFELSWLPAATGGLGYWPSGTTLAPPIDAMTFQIEHREVTLPATYGPWEPIQPGDNVVVGTRDNVDAPIGLAYGSNLAELFPVRRPRAAGAGYTLQLSDVFDVGDTSGIFQRPAPAFGTYHQYQIRAMDTVGRVSSDWTLSNIVRFEKHVPPPLPVGPQPEPELILNPDGSTQLSAPLGVKARAIVVGDSKLSAADLSILGSHRNAVVLSWGWRDTERQTDPLTKEFRIYDWLTPPDVIPGTITSVTAASSGWDLGFQTNRVMQDGDCVGQWIDSGGYSFQIATLTAEPSIVIHVLGSLANPTAAPVVGPVQFGRPLDISHQRPAQWDQRVAVAPLSSASSYEYVFYDVLQLSPSQPLDTIWVGVSAADGESYVDDELVPPAVNAGRPGNESSIVTCVVSARDHTRPVFTIPPPVGDVPELVAEEPTGRQVLVSIDLAALLPGALPAGQPIALDRCAADSILNITSLSAASQVQLLLNDGTQHVITFPNPGDESAVVAMLQISNPERMPTKYLLYLATHHPRPVEIFERTSKDILAFGAVADRLAPKPARYFYRVRLADVQGRVSTDGAILPIVVRVPSITPPIAPERTALSATPCAVSITLRVPPDRDVSSLLVFTTTMPLSSPVTDLTRAELLRTPNRRELYPLHGIRLRPPVGDALLSPIAKALSDPDVATDGDGNLLATLSVPATFGNWVILWTYSLSIDGIPSRVAGPFTIGVPKS
jgi:hypothetical protein